MKAKREFVAKSDIEQMQVKKVKYTIFDLIILWSNICIFGIISDWNPYYYSRVGQFIPNIFSEITIGLVQIERQ